MKSPEGLYTALVTPFHEGKVDIAGLKKNVSFQLAEGVAGLVPLGTTGETPTLSREEKDLILSTVVEEVSGKVPVIAGTGSNSTQKTIEETRRALDLGADAALVVTPYYSKPTQPGIIGHYEAIAAAVDIPIIQYNIRSRCGVNVETSTMLRLAEIPTVVGVKEASGDIQQIGDVIEQIQNTREDFSVLSGDDAMTYPLLALGGKGVIAVTSNLVPSAFVSLVKKALAGDLVSARKEHYGLLSLFKVLFIESNPAPVKYAMNLAGMPAGDVRLPLSELVLGSQSAVEETLRSLKLLS